MAKGTNTQLWAGPAGLSNTGLNLPITTAPNIQGQGSEMLFRNFKPNLNKIRSNLFQRFQIVEVHFVIHVSAEHAGFPLGLVRGMLWFQCRTSLDQTMNCSILSSFLLKISLFGSQSYRGKGRLREKERDRERD